MSRTDDCFDQHLHLLHCLLCKIHVRPGTLENVPIRFLDTGNQKKRSRAGQRWNAPVYCIL